MSGKIKIRPGRAQSIVGFAVGAAFCLIGIFMVIPAAGVFGILWTAMALIITIINGINIFTDKGVASHEIVIDDDGYKSDEKCDTYGTDAYDKSVNMLKEDIEDRLRIAEELYNAGTITKDEYEEKRGEILEKL